MAQPYVGEIRMFGGNFPPAGWMFCNGQLLPISENEVLFQLIGTTYGGDGQETFALPNLQGRLPLHAGTLSGQTFQIGESAGSESVTLTGQQIPNHTHSLLASTTQAQNPQPQNSILAQGPTVQAYIADVGAGAISPNAISPVGGNQPHENMQPYLCVSFIISLFGIFPSQT
ncbi:microcystin-dependent protein [Tahibacter aquaticus]|uniref:Microcystin-dependent protein n=1 Tax=Tahibacter aquaticus TaxID=520092 RepID=A0A4R6Z4F7_9GAMM|nr:tail fiber protein [Tahibacter aquaticus]TDR46567.1 microcystin-dependent protein [Tahibacter aquaticus]